MSVAWPEVPGMSATRYAAVSTMFVRCAHRSKIEEHFECDIGCTLSDRPRDGVYDQLVPPG